MGAFVGFVATAIMFYYSVVAGWCFYYTGTSLLSGLPISLASAQTTWEGISGVWPAGRISRGCDGTGSARLLARRALY